MRAGERWIYSAGCNVDPSMTSTERIDVELSDLARLAGCGARVAVLSHQGRHHDGTARPLGHVADYLRDRLGRPVRYVPDNASDEAERLAGRLAEGEIALFGNTRTYAGEECNDPGLAAAFARLGDLVAVGGFSKAHRAHASNVGLLDLLPGYATDGLVREMEALAPWAGIDDARYSVAVLGGTKPEKTLVGLANLTRTYDLVIPGGVVLNTVLAVLGHDIGRSELGDRPERCAAAAELVLGHARRAELHVPDEVVVVDPDAPTDPRIVAVNDGVPAGHMIVDFVLTPRVRERLAGLSGCGGRAVMAGTPSCYATGHRDTTDALLAAFAAPAVDALLLGGDTVAELPWSGPVSTGGGSALEYLTTGRCAVVDALRRQDHAAPEEIR